MPITLPFLTDFDENVHEGLFSDGELESVLILKNLFCTVSQKLFFVHGEIFAVDYNLTRL